MLPIFPPLYDDTSERLLESKTTVFGFWVQPLGARAPLDKAALKKMHADLATDLSGDYGSFDAPIMSGQFHLGQPVDLGPAGSVLRVALGGELITRVSTDCSLGETLDERLEWMHEQLHALRQKIEYLALRPALNHSTELARDIPVERLATSS
jgi:hypothetical protein